MDVVEVEELEEEEDLKSSVTLTPLSMQDLLDFYEGNLVEEEGGSDGKEAGGGKSEESGGKEVGGDDSLEKKESSEEGRDIESEGSKGGDLESKGSKSEDLESKGSKGGDLESKGSRGSRLATDTSVAKSSSSEDRSLSSVGKSSIMEEKPSSIGVAADPSAPIKTTASEATMEAASKPVPSHPTKPTSLLERRLTAGKSRMVSLLRMREVCGMSSRPTSPSGPGAMWDHEQLNKAQFVQLVELFVGREPRQDLVDAIAEFIRTSYTQAEKVILYLSLVTLHLCISWFPQDKVEHKDQAQLLGMLQAKRRRVHLLFDTWDNDSSGFLELEELQHVLCKWKDFSTETAREQG